MTMLPDHLEDITEAHILKLATDEIQESLTLEFKRELNIKTKKERCEVCKDVSALANTAGGRIVYGLDEKKLEDGTVVAGDIAPLHDGDVMETLQNILFSSIHPRPRIRTRRVKLEEDGFILVVEVYPAYASDLHMVEGYKDYRFYKRGPTGVEPMTEPEIREAYRRITTSRAALDDELQRNTTEELATRPCHPEESIIVMPWHSRPMLVDPRDCTDLKSVLDMPDFVDSGVFNVLGNLKVFSGGFRGWFPIGEEPNEARRYLAIRSTGIVHLSHAEVDNFDNGFEQTMDLLVRLIFALRVAQRVLERVRYWGPVRVLYRLNLRIPRPLTFSGRRRVLHRAKITNGLEVVAEANLKEAGGNLGGIVKEIMDRMVQSEGISHHPWFEADGTLKSNDGVPDVIRTLLQTSESE